MNREIFRRSAGRASTFRSVKNRTFFPQPPWMDSRRSGKCSPDPASEYEKAELSLLNVEYQPPHADGLPAQRQSFDASSVDAGCETRRVERQPQVAVRVLQKIIQYQRSTLVLLVDRHAKLHHFHIAHIDA